MSSYATHSSTNPLQTIDKRILMAIVGFAVAAVVGAASMVGAQPADKPTKEFCASQNFKNYGQCVKQWAHSKGYGSPTH